jgi:hypothetical protein
MPECNSRFATLVALTLALLIDMAAPQFGYSHQYERTVLFFFSWRTTDLPQEKTNALDLE